MTTETRVNTVGEYAHILVVIDYEHDAAYGNEGYRKGHRSSKKKFMKDCMPINERKSLKTKTKTLISP